MAYQTIPPSSGGACASDPWGDEAAAFVAEKVPTLVSVVFRNKCETVFAVGGAAGGGAQSLERAAVSGSGADAAVDITKNGGVIKFTTGTTGGSFRVVRNMNGVAAAGLRSDFVSNIRTQKIAIVIRILMDAPTSTCDFEMIKITDEATANAEVLLRALGSTSTTNWALTVGSAATVELAGATLPTVAFETLALILDGTNVTLWNVDTGLQLGASQAQVTAGTVAGHLAMLATNSAAANKNVWIDDVVVITEPAA